MHFIGMPSNPFVSSLLLILSMMTIVYVISLIKNDYSVIDVFWPLGFLLVASYILDYGYVINHTVIKIFVTIWALRLSFYLLYRIVKHGPDKRYRELQREWGKHHRIHAFFKVFMLQGAFMFLIAMPITTATYVIETNILSLWLGSLIWLFGFLLELGADIQLYTFKQKSVNKGKYLMTGLYKYSRHPNYLGEIILWYGIALIAIPNEYWYLSILGPTVLLFALYKFSGVPYAERNASKSPAYQVYMEKTGAIFPKIF